MSAYGSSSDKFDDFEWEERLSFNSQQFEKFTEKKTDSHSKLRTRRQIEDIQERRKQKKRLRFAMDEWDMAY